MRLFFTILLVIPIISFGQIDIGIKGGLNIPNLANIGIYASTKKLDFGIDYGSAPVEIPSFYSISSNLMYHFGDGINLSKTSTWYLKGNYTYNYERSNSATRYNHFLGLTAGRKWKFENRLSLSFDLGMAYMIYHKKILRQPSTYNIEVYPKLIPSGGITLYFSLYKFESN